MTDVVESLEREVVVVDEVTIEIIEVAAQGPQGEPGESGGGGGGDVASVNGHTGVVVLAASDIGALPDDDPSVTNARPPTPHKATHATGGPDALAPGDIGAEPSGTAAAAVATETTARTAADTAHAALTTTAHGGVVSSSDGRLTNARAPTAHKATHATGGSDPLAPADIGAEVAGTASSTVAAEATARATADSSLSSTIDTESTARQAADTSNAAAASSAQATADAALPRAGGTMTGALVLAGDPTANLNPATRQWVLAQINALINGAPSALDTLKEIADQLAGDEGAVSALTSTVAGKLASASNLGDLTNAVTARSNLGLGSAATHPVGDFDNAGAAAMAQAASQPLDSDLTAIAALGTTAFGRSFLALVDAASALSTIGGVGTSDARLTDTRTPTDGAVTNAKVSASAAIAESKLSLASDAAAGTASRRTLGTGAQQAAAGTDSRLSDARTPTAHKASHEPGGSDALTALTDASFASANKDGAASVASLRTLTALSKIYVPAPGVVSPVGWGPVVQATSAIGTAFKAIFHRVVIPQTGTLHDLAVWNGGTLGGNTNVAVFDTGDTSAGSYTPLWSSGAVGMSGANAWQIIGDPALAVTAGQQLLFALMNSGTTALFGKPNNSFVAAGASQLPASFMPVTGGALPKLAGSFTFGSLVYSAITEANLVGVTASYTVIGRIS